MDKCRKAEEGIPVDVADVIRKRKQANLEYNRKVRETTRKSYNDYINIKMKERYKTNANFRLKEAERSNLKTEKRKQKQLMILKGTIAL